MSNKITYILATLLLLFVLIICIFSIRDDSLTMDELAHLPAGYSYLVKQDMRLNPEHPPLMKDLAGLPLLFMGNINFPSEIGAWDTEINGQWDFGNQFLFRSNNPAEQMIFLARIPMILLLILLGFYVFRWTRELFGNKASILALFFFSFSPTFLAHGRLVTTDVAAAFGVFFASYYFIKFLKDNSKKNLIKAGLALGVAQLLKFSLILLFPFFGILILIWAIVESKKFVDFFRNFGRYVWYCVLIGLVALVLITIVYQFHVWNYPPERQANDIQETLKDLNPGLVNATVWMTDKPVLRPIAQYMFGVFMVIQRATGGNTGYYFGELSNLGWKSYFPFVWFAKEPLAFHLLNLFAAIAGIFVFKKLFSKRPIVKTTIAWLKFHFAELAGLIFTGIYWTTSMSGNLNIGVRHLLPVLPFTIMIIAGNVSMFTEKSPLRKVKKALLYWLILWQAFSVINVFPFFLTYFNEAWGGPTNGHKYVTDSNLDWGQDLKRLKMWLDENNINKVHIDYFGGSDLDYYLKEKYAPWWGTRPKEELEPGSYLAVSATKLQGGRGVPIPGFEIESGYYKWLDQHEPVTVIGNSIFIYKID